MILDQLIEYKIEKIFLKKSYITCNGKTIPSPFSKESNLSIFLYQKSKVLYSLFLSYAKLKATERYWN